jgi:hypothetical protein
MPRTPLPWVGRLRTYTGLRRTAGRLESIMDGPARWERLCDLVDEARTAAAKEPVFCLT